MTADQLLERILWMVPLILSLSVHEWAHAWSAHLLGDDTARLQGRLSLNPAVHVDPIGTLLLPFLGIPFGWAKPVPVNPMRFTRRWSLRGGIAIVAAAGPISNVVLAAVCSLLLWLVARFNPVLLDNEPWVYQFFTLMIVMNVLLALFNCLPIPPLDGSRIADSFMPQSLRPAWDTLCGMGPILLGAVIVLPMLTGFNLFSAPLMAVLKFVRQIGQGQGF